jgi:hypothetical protein
MRGLNARLAETEKWCQELQARLEALDQAGVPTIVQKSDARVRNVLLFPLGRCLIEYRKEEIWDALERK